MTIAFEPSFVDGLRARDTESGPVADIGLSLSFGVVGLLVGSARKLHSRKVLSASAYGLDG